MTLKFLCDTQHKPSRQKTPPQQGQIFILALASQVWWIPVWPQYVLPNLSIL